MTTAFASGQCLTIVGTGRSEILIHSREVTTNDVQNSMDGFQPGIDTGDLVRHRDAYALVAFRLLDEIGRQIVKPFAVLVAMLRR